MRCRSCHQRTPATAAGGDEDQRQRCASRPRSAGVSTAVPNRVSSCDEHGWCDTTCHASAVRTCAEVVSAGAVVLGPGGTVLLVHRPKYDDWSFPKGKLDRGEHATAAAVREVEEETGAPGPARRAAARPALPDPGRHQAGALLDRPGGRRRRRRAATSRTPRSTRSRWFPIDKARRRLTYEFDVDTLDEALEQAQKTRTLVILRHSQARSRKAWRARRPRASAAGHRQAPGGAAGAAALGVRRAPAGQLVAASGASRPSSRTPRRAGCKLRTDHLLSEEDADPKAVRAAADRAGERPPRSAGRRPAAWSSARTGRCCRWSSTRVGLDDPGLAPGELVVLHLRKGRIRAVERHRSRAEHRRRRPGASSRARPFT